jgi:hypothetical protein
MCTPLHPALITIPSHLPSHKHTPQTSSPMPPERTPHRSTLLARYKQLIEQDLPLAARNKSDAQSRWPVHLNHCFGRIILDHICQRPWREVLQAPAVRNMSVAQLGKAVQVGEGILGGTIDLEELNRGSLQMRAKSRSESESKSKVGQAMGETAPAGLQNPSTSASISSQNLITAPEPKSGSRPADLRDLPAKAKHTESKPKIKKTIWDYFSVEVGSP